MEVRTGGAPRIVERTVSLKGQNLRVAIRPGDGGQTPLLLMNGLGARLEVLYPLLEELDPALEVICFDVPGIGDSPAPAIPYCPTSLVDLVVEMLVSLGYQQVDVLGVSWGGWLAQQFAFQYSSRCRRLILVSTGPGVLGVPGQLNVLASMLLLWRFIDPVVLKRSASSLFGGNPHRHSKRFQAFLLEMQSSTLSGYFYQLFAVTGWTSLPWLWLLAQPTLILSGDDDRIVPPINGSIIQQLIPRSELYTYSGGHLGLFVNLEEIVPVITRFLTR